MDSETVISRLVFKQLKIDDSSNQSCFDCNGPHTQYASVPNGTFICGSCADLHKKLLKHPKLSYIKSISMEPWSEEQMIIMALGGNKKMQQHLAKFEILNIDDTLEARIVRRVRSRAAEFYRVQLRAKVEGVSFESAVDPPSLEYAQELIPEHELKQINERDLPMELRSTYDELAYPGVNDISFAMQNASEYITSAANYAYETTNVYGVNDKILDA